MIKARLLSSYHRTHLTTVSAPQLIIHYHSCIIVNGQSHYLSKEFQLLLRV
jgi:hypothetical protein